MVAFGILLQNVGKWQGPSNAIFHSLTEPFYFNSMRNYEQKSMQKVCKNVHVILTFGIVMTKWPVV